MIAAWIGRLAGGAGLDPVGPVAIVLVALAALLVAEAVRALTAGREGAGAGAPETGR
jgi:hypothetical protein